jgi:GST-like protein
MTEFPARWAPAHPDRIQLYSLATPNGMKIGIALEELELPYEAHRIDFGERDQFHADFVAINPNSKIPAIIDPTGAEPFAIMESGAILIHLADKAGRLLPSSGAKRSAVLQWLFFQAGSIGPMFGQFGHFHKFAADKTSDTYANERYTTEAKRLLGVLNTRLADNEYLAGEYSIADIATAPWVAALDYYEGRDVLGYDEFEHVEAWKKRCLERPAAIRGMQVTPF